jgi:hypothetical protein
MHTRRKKWILGGLGLVLMTIVVTKYGEHSLGIFRKDREPTQSHITTPATLQAFDERLSLSMPVAFGTATDLPLEKLPAEARGSVQRMTQRAAYFNGVYIVVMKLTNTRGIKGNVEENLHNIFTRTANPPSPTMPRISSIDVNGVYESGAIRFPAVFGNSRGQMTAVVIKAGTEDAFWCLNAWGKGEAADLAERTVKEFAFK